MSAAEAQHTGRIALAYDGDSREPSAWSGIPRNLADALQGAGVEVVHVSAEPGRLERRLRRLSIHGEDRAAAATAAFARRLRRSGSVDAVLQLGSEFTAPDGVRVATYDDMTILQARRLEHPLLDRLGEAEIEAWAERQRSIFAAATACFTAARWAADSVIEDYGVPAERVHVVGFGRNLDPRPVDREWSPPRYLFVGQDWRRKGGETLLAAFRAVRERVPGATLTVVGHHPRLAAEPGLELTGGLWLNRAADRDRMERLYESSTCLVLPSEIEPAGIVYLEAAAAGVPSIGTTVGGAAEMIGDGGRLVDPGDVDGLTAAMLELADPETAASLGAAAREHCERFTWPKIADRIATVLDL
jgi:glycosyltransferase involved in cell wall biosynthesis